MTIIDLSQNLDKNCSIYPGDPAFACHRVSTVEKDHFNVTSLSLGSHTGTHIDAPYHCFEDGQTVDEINLSQLIGPAAVVDLSGKKGSRERITWDDDLAPYSDLIKKHNILLIHTGWSKYWGTQEYFNHPFLDKSVAVHALARGVRVLGVDALSPDETHLEDVDADLAVHETLLVAGVIIAENLTNLDKLPADGATVSLFPLRLTGCDGSPVRAVAWTTMQEM